MNKTLLVIDDDGDTTEIVHIYFKMKGFTVYCAKNALEGIMICQEVKPEIILLDLKMPGMDGTHAIPFLREAAPQARILLWSGFDLASLGLRAEDLDIEGYIEKPLSILELCNAIQQNLTYLENSKTAYQSAAARAEIHTMTQNSKEPGYCLTA